MGKQHLSRDDRIFVRGKLQGTRENIRQMLKEYDVEVVLE